MKGKLALEVDRGDCRGRVGDWVGLGVKGERTRKIESQSFGPEPFENFGTGFYFRSACRCLLVEFLVFNSAFGTSADGGH